MTSALASPTIEKVIQRLRPLPSPKARSFRYASLDMWRGVACVMVVLCHSVTVFSLSDRWNEESLLAGVSMSLLSPMRFGGVGVPMFFVISGYCIAATACSAKLRQTPLRTYFWRRFRRIYPPYWVALASLVAVFAAVDVVIAPRLLSSQPFPVGRPWWSSPSQWLGNITLTETWRHHLVGNGRAHIMSQSWTLCYEEQFYLIIGLLLLFPRRAFFPLCGLVTLGTLMVQQIARVQGIDVTGFFFDGQWFAFAFGLAVFFALNYLQARGKCITFLLLVVAAIVCGYLTGWGEEGLATAAAFAALLIPLRAWDAHLGKLWLLAPLFWCGTMCYSLYLLHSVVVPVVSRVCYAWGVTSAAATLFITVPLCLGGSIAASWLFYQFVERRFLNSPAPVSAS